MRTFLAAILFFSASVSAQSIETRTLYSPLIKDSFIINVRKPHGLTNDKSYHIIYVADGSLKMGNYILGKDSSWRADVPEGCVIVTIAHIGNWHMKRQRDFLPSDAGGHKEENFGQARNFYLFLKDIVIPYVNQRFPKRQSTAFIGHSFSGLFCLYTLFQEDPLFNRHFAISPSVWANHSELLKIEERYSKRKDALRARVSLLAGGLEVFNKVLASTKEFYTQTSSRKYTGYSVSFSTVNNANHYSIIKPGVDKALAVFRN